MLVKRWALGIFHKIISISFKHIGFCYQGWPKAEAIIRKGLIDARSCVPTDQAGITSTFEFSADQK